MTFTLAALAARVGGEVVGDPQLALARVAPLEEAGPGDLSFFSNRKYRRAFEESRAGAVLVEPDEEAPPGRTLLRAKNAYLAFAKIATLFHPPAHAVPGVSAQASVQLGARVDPTAQVMPLAFVGTGAVVGPRCILHPVELRGAGGEAGRGLRALAGRGGPRRLHAG